MVYFSGFHREHQKFSQFLCERKRERWSEKGTIPVISLFFNSQVASLININKNKISHTVYGDGLEDRKYNNVFTLTIQYRE